MVVHQHHLVVVLMVFLPKYFVFPYNYLRGDNQGLQKLVRWCQLLGMIVVDWVSCEEDIQQVRVHVPYIKLEL